MKNIAIALLLAVLTACTGEVNTGAQHSLQDLKGQWVVVNYWAQWCKPCIEEIPELNELNQARDNVTVLGVNYEDARDEVLREQEERLGVTFVTITDPSAELGIPRPVVLPTTLLIDPDGNVVETLVGPQTLESLESSIAAATQSRAANSAQN